MRKKMLSALLVSALFLLCLPCANALVGDAERACETLTALGLVSGTGTGSALGEEAAQEQGITLLVRMLGETEAAQRDTRQCGWVRMKSWAKASINYAAYHALLLPEEYHPERAMSADLWCAMLLRGLGYSESSGDFTADTAMACARRIGLLPYDLPETMDRASMFESALAALQFRYHGSSETMLDRLAARGLVPCEAAQSCSRADRPMTAREVFDRVGSAVFQLALYDPDEDTDEADEMKQDGDVQDEGDGTEAKPSATASGFFITPDGVAVTNYHSIDGAERATATLANGEQLAVSRVLFYDRDLDLAIIRLESRTLTGTEAKEFACIPLVGTDELRVGDTVYAIGNPLGLGICMSQGIVGALEREVNLSDLPSVVSDASISHGSSGGVLLNVYAQAVAVTTGAYAAGNNMYLNVPVDPLKDVDLTQEGKTLAEVLKEVEAAKAAEKAETTENEQER